MLLDLNMWKNQIFYAPEDYAQYTDNGSKTAKAMYLCLIECSVCGLSSKPPNREVSVTVINHRNSFITRPAAYTEFWILKSKSFNFLSDTPFDPLVEVSYL